ncbi:MAG: fdhA2 [Myxococcales bacterium]|nr:fdhA2 [Myxococcales bacterium]
MEARRRGATIIHIDPRFTRTSAMANLHVPIRAGTDVAFLGGIVRYILENERYFRDYVVAYTNAATLIKEEFQDTEDLDGLFSGWDPKGGHYDVESWQYEGTSDTVPAAGHKEIFAEKGAGIPRKDRGRDVLDEKKDETLQHPRCVFQLLKRHFARYTPEMVERITGCPQELFLKVAQTLCDNSGRDRTSAFAYAVGWTQHSIGVQYIRTAGIIQLLLGNIGRPGGGIMALRGHASIQGSTDIPTLYNLLPGYLPMPHAEHAPDLAAYIHGNEAATNWWSEFSKYVKSLLKAWWGAAADASNDFCFDYLPKLTGNHAHMVTVKDMADGHVSGYLVVGENPVVGSPNGALQRRGLRRARWLVVRDFQPTETAEFWRTSPEHERGEVRAEEIGTEVFFFPAAAHTEKDGTFTNTQRLLQWHHKAIDPPGDARSDLHFAFHLGRRLKALYADSRERRDEPIQRLTWDYPTEGRHDDPSAEAVLREINGYTVADGKPVSGFTELKADGSTACGCWIYAGCYAEGVNQTARRKSHREQIWVAPDWGWAWPANRRILYNRASADPDGKPWSERKRYVWWDEKALKWTGSDVPDFIVDRPPSYRPNKRAKGLDAIGGNDPFLLQADGKGWLFAPSGMMDGPMPTHYEPQESVVRNLLYKQQCNPARHEFRRRDNRYHRAFDDPRFPLVMSTFRLTEHHTAGGMSRTLPWLSELQPEMFCEISPALARARGVTNGDWATLTTARGMIECRVLVTERMTPLAIDGRRIEQVGVPWHWGAVGRVRGDAANELTAFGEDPNVNIMESKALTCDLVAGRRPRGEAGREAFARLDDALTLDADERRALDEEGLRGAGPPLPEPTQMEPKG